MSNKKMILVAGPYRSGTGDDSNKIAANLQHMNQVALQVLQAGFLPMVGEWIALSLIETAGSTKIGDSVFTDIFHPVAIDLLANCDGVLRTGGASQGADQMVSLAKEMGKPVFTSVEQVRF
ncbi:DUF4406 domain-containing protein [Rhodocytophaga rosea]|uniref:DUF4406 domain-containing protein n=1 Tax=Rhodocytophaga rosea TaxID=2704465 RepID=A0A6C0GE77_9BACT|nr:DUF4406 domain-containing protein [Rhodocytophaga rosea]QHT66309.1 DUF4406 domain-containing protein [Rhodocytophaga rosea]